MRSSFMFLYVGAHLAELVICYCISILWKSKSTLASFTYLYFVSLLFYGIECLINMIYDFYMRKKSYPRPRNVCAWCDAVRCIQNFYYSHNRSQHPMSVGVHEFQWQSVPCVRWELFNMFKARPNLRWCPATLKSHHFTPTWIVWACIEAQVRRESAQAKLP